MVGNKGWGGQLLGKNPPTIRKEVLIEEKSKRETVQRIYPFVRGKECCAMCMCIRHGRYLKIVKHRFLVA